MDERLVTAAEHWALPRQADGSRWWMHPIIHRHLNRLICGEALDGPVAGFHRRIGEMRSGGRFGRAVSIGCGVGGKEMRLIRAGVVDHFDLYEIGEHRRAQIEAKAKELGVADAITIHIADAFDIMPDGVYDLVYWNNALHHMFDAVQSVA